MHLHAVQKCDYQKKKNKKTPDKYDLVHSSDFFQGTSIAMDKKSTSAL